MGGLEGGVGVVDEDGGCVVGGLVDGDGGGSVWRGYVYSAR